jgi:cytochrome bd-type quinol oxidase subunit 2
MLRPVLVRRISRSAIRRPFAVGQSVVQFDRDADAQATGRLDTGGMTTPTNDHLAATLHDLMRSGSATNPALNKLLDDYTKYHVVVAVVGGLFVIGFVVLSLVLWRQFRRAHKAEGRRWSVERKSYFSFSMLSVVVGLLLAVVVAANVSTARSPRPGFVGTFAMIPNARAGTQTEELHRAFTVWLQSGSTAVPAVVQHKIDSRLAWQRPKAIISSFLLIFLVALSAFIWRTLISRSRSAPTRKRQGAALRVAGVASVGSCLLLTLMVLGNTAASVAPLAMTLVFG